MNGAAAMEFWDLYNDKREKTGRIHERGKALPEGYYHLCVSVWLVNRKGEFLLSQRHPDKEYPLCWECTGGSVLAGESSFKHDGIRVRIIMMSGYSHMMWI